MTTFLPFLIASRNKFMHNGGIADFHLIKRRLQAELSDDIYNMIQGNTGEHNTPANGQIVIIFSQTPNALLLYFCQRYVFQWFHLSRPRV